MMSPTPTWLTREKMIHEKVFDTLSRPFSRAIESNDDGMGMFSGIKVKWNHFGKKYSLRISDYEMEYTDIFDAFMKKVHEVRPDFEGALAYIDQYGRQQIISSDRELREALTHSKNKLKLHTTLAEGAVISAAEIAGRPSRSQSVPPVSDRAYHSYPPVNSRSPSSMDSAPATYRNRAASPPPVSSSHSTQPVHVRTATSSYSGYHPQLSPGGMSYAPYSQNLLFGMPPHNGMLLRFLANPFPFGSYHRTFVGPNKYHHFGGGWGGGGRYYSSGFGPIW